MEVDKYLDIIISGKDDEKMKELRCIFEKTVARLEHCDNELYNKTVNHLYEIVYGKSLTEEKAGDWIRSMRPFGMKWTLEQTNQVMRDMKYECRDIDFWAIMNAMYNDYQNIFEENVEIYAKMAYNFINDPDALPNKVYTYWKKIASK